MTMTQFFCIGMAAVGEHLKNIFAEGGLYKEVVVSRMEISTQKGEMEKKPT